MAKNRMINTKYYIDPYIRSLDKDGKFLLLYLFTNYLTDISGIYEIPKDIIVSDTGIELEKIEFLLKKFEKDDKIVYRDSWLWLKNFTRHQADKGNVRIGIERSLEEIPEKILNKLGVNVDSLKSLEEPSRSLNNSNSNLNSNSKINTEILELWNSKKITVHKKLSSKTERLIGNLLKEFSLDDIKKGINTYAEVLNSEETFWTYKWTLEEFLQRQNGFRVFVYKSIDDYKEKSKTKSNNEEPEYI